MKNATGMRVELPVFVENDFLRRSALIRLSLSDAPVRRGSFCPALAAVQQVMIKFPLNGNRYSVPFCELFV